MCSFARNGCGNKNDDDLFVNPPTSKIYNLFKRETPVLSKKKVQDMYNKAKEYLDKSHFKKEFFLENKTKSRLWELKLINSVIESGITLDKESKSSGQPDVIADEYHIEAVLVGLGNGDNNVNLIPMSDCEANIEMHNVTHDKRNRMLLRCTESIDRKMKKRNDHIKADRKVSKIPYIIALSLSEFSCDYIIDRKDLMELGMLLTYGVDSMKVSLCLDSNKVTKGFTESIEKNSETNIPVGIFRDDKYKYVSGIILSRDSLDFYGKDSVTALSSFNQNSIYIKNHNAINKTDDNCNFLSPITFNCFKESTASCE